jgi:hypothetical protein
MIRIETKYGALDIGKKEKLTIEENSPFIDKEFRRGMFSLPFSVLGTDNNKRILKSYSLEEEMIDNIPASLYSDDVLISEGFIYINSVNRNYRTGAVKYKLTFANELGFFSKKIESLNINDCYKYLEAIPASTTPFIVGTSTTYTMLPTTKLVNDTYDTPSDVYAFPTVLFKVGTYDQTRSPFKIANYNELFTTSVLGSTLADPLRLSYAIWNPKVAIPYGNDKIDEPDFYQDRHAVFGSYIIPFFYYHNVLKACFTKVGYDVEFNFKNDDVREAFYRLLIANNYNILKPIFENTIVSSTQVDTSIYEDATEINSDNHLPKLSVKEFINDFMLKFCTYPKFIGSRVVFDIIEIDKNLQNLGGVLPEIETTSNKKENVVLSYNFSTDSNPDNIPDYYFTNYEDGQKKELSTSVLPPLELKGESFDADFMLFGTRAVFGNPSIGAPWSYAPFMLLKNNAYIESDISHPTGNKIISISGAATDSWYTDNVEHDCPVGMLFSNYFEKLVPGVITVAFKCLVGNMTDAPTGISLAWTNNAQTGLVDLNYASSKVLYTSGRKISIQCSSSYLDVLQFNWDKQQLIKGQKFVTAKRRYTLPLSENNIVTYELYQS